MREHLDLARLTKTAEEALAQLETDRASHRPPAPDGYYEGGRFVLRPFGIFRAVWDPATALAVLQLAGLAVRILNEPSSGVLIDGQLALVETGWFEVTEEQAALLQSMIDKARKVTPG